MAAFDDASRKSLNTTGFYLGPSTLDSTSEHITNNKLGNTSKQHHYHDSPSCASSVTQDATGTSRSSATTPSSNNSISLSLSTAMEQLRSDMPAEDGYIAFGTIEVHTRSDGDGEAQSYIRGRSGDEPYPNPVLSNAIHRGWMRTEDLIADSDTRLKRLRLYVLPEDVNRAKRGSVKDFRKAIKFLLAIVDCSSDAWIDRSQGPRQMKFYEAPRTQDEESLFYIFNTLRSPSPDLESIRNSVYGYQAVDDVMNDTIAGLKTQLYSYQRRSVATMVQREADPANLLDPRKTSLKDIHGQPFYLDFQDHTLLKAPTLYPEPQGGILAETMGYGKTLICIALILATRGHYPKVPEDRVDHVTLEPRQKVGSLLAMAARRLKHEGIPWKAEFAALGQQGYHYDSCLEELSKYDRSYHEPIFTPTTPSRKGKRESANVVHLCSTTLILVPPNLLMQWEHEIRKHVHDGALDVLVIDKPSQVIKDWKQIMQYDIVLMTKSRFEQEYRDDDLNQGKSTRGDVRYCSPLTQVRWLRVICDEGHGFAGSSTKTNAMAMLDKMYIERRWVVSGTPSSTLHGVEVGLTTTNSASITSHNREKQSKSSNSRRYSIETALQKRRLPSMIEEERKDLDRLRLICINFLRLQPWANQRGSHDCANWKQYLATTVDENGQRQTPPALREVLQTLIIRHRIEDIDTDLTLPALHTRTVYLEPSYHDKLAINMFMLVLASNYVTSEREDEDYMFHPRNRKKFDLLVNNLRHASFHWVGFSEHDIKETVRISNYYLDNNIDKVSDEDALLLTEAILNGERALSDSSWTAFSKLHEMGVFIQDFPQHARLAWALDERPQTPLLLGTVQAREVQRYFKERVLNGVSDPLSSLAGKGTKVMNAAREEALKEQNEKSKSETIEVEKKQLGFTEEPRLRAATSSRSNQKQGTLNVKVTKPSTKRSRSSSAIGPASPSTPIILTSDIKLVPSDIPPATVTGFSSSKLTYLIDQLLIHSSTSKSIIFYSSNNTAFWVAEALELMHIPFLIYANTLSVVQRNSYLAMFNSDDSIRVLLMDLKQASHGLHVACANRVYIIAPIWDKGVESQAIKRAHRIGQTKDVYVETLVLKGTFEEEMVKRRIDIDQHNGQEDKDIAEDDILADTGTENVTQEARSSQSIPSPASKSPNKRQTKNKQNTRSLLDDRHMVQVLKNIKFLKFTKNEDLNIDARVSKLTVEKGKRLLFGGLVPVEEITITPPATPTPSLQLLSNRFVRQHDHDSHAVQNRITTNFNVKKNHVIANNKDIDEYNTIDETTRQEDLDGPPKKKARFAD